MTTHQVIDNQLLEQARRLGKQKSKLETVAWLWKQMFSGASVCARWKDLPRSLSTPSLTVKEHGTSGDFQDTRARRQGQSSTTRLSFSATSLFFPPEFSKFAGQFFVNVAPVTDGEYPYDMRFAIGFVNDAEPSNFKLPKSGQFPH